MVEIKQDDQNIRAPSKRPLSVSSIVAMMANVITIAAGLVAIAGIWVWIDEKSDRDEERAARAEDGIARRIALIGQAQAVLLEESKDNQFGNDHPMVNWAMSTLIGFGIPIEVSARDVSISDFDFNCADATFRTDRFEGTRLRAQNSSLVLRAGALKMQNVVLASSNLKVIQQDSSNLVTPVATSFVDSNLQDVDLLVLWSDQRAPPYSLSPHSVTFRWSKIANSHVAIQDGGYDIKLIGADIRETVFPRGDCSNTNGAPRRCPIQGNDAPVPGAEEKLTDDAMPAPNCQRPAHLRRYYVGTEAVAPPAL